MQNAPQLYLITPARYELLALTKSLTALLDTGDIACVRLDLPGAEEAELRQTGDALRAICHERDVPIVLADHFRLAGQLGFDGVHMKGARGHRAARDELGNDAIVGAYCGASRHDGLQAGEAGATYVSFGPIATSPLGDGASADLEMFDWWSEMIEVPLVAEGGLDEASLTRLAPVVDFVALRNEIWDSEQPLTQLAKIKAILEQHGSAD